MSADKKNKKNKQSGDQSTVNPRSVALTGLLAVRDGRTMDDALNPLLPKLEERDRALTKRLATGTLRSMGTLDTKAKQYMSRRFPDKALRARLVMNMGLYQLADSESPDYAIISTCLKLLEGKRAQPFKPVVDAILRKVSAERDTWRKEFAESRALWLPRWLKNKWEGDYDTEMVDRIAIGASSIPFTDLSFVSNDARQAFISELSDEIKYLELPNGGLRLGNGHGAITRLPLFKEGTWWVQDYAASLPALILKDGLSDGLTGKSVLDLCAAPGGKSLQLASYGANVTAIELSEMRAARLTQNLQRCASALQGEVTVEVADVLKMADDKQFDAILLDAPCSASGTLRRHPEWPYLRKEETYLENRKLQVKMLFQAAKLLKPEGKMVYATCSLDPEEGLDHIHKARSVLTHDPLGPEADFLNTDLLTDGSLRTFPFSSPFGDAKDEFSKGMDGFFAARFSRV